MTSFILDLINPRLPTMQITQQMGLVEQKIEYTSRPAGPTGPAICSSLASPQSDFHISIDLRGNCASEALGAEVLQICAIGEHWGSQILEALNTCMGWILPKTRSRFPFCGTLNFRRISDGILGKEYCYREAFLFICSMLSSCLFIVC